MNLSLLYKGPSIKYVTQFLANFYPLLLSHFVTHPGTPPRKYVTHLAPPSPTFRRPSTRNPDNSPIVQILSQLFAGFVRGFCQRVFCLEGFLRGGFCPFPFCQ